MPVTKKITGPRGSGFWASLELEDGQLLQAIVKEEFQRSEPADEIHYIPSRADDMPPKTLYMQVSLPCLRNCLVFLYRGAIFIQGATTETGHAYAVENEEWLSLSKDTTILVMEQGAMKGICNQKTDEEDQRANRARDEAWKARVTLKLSEYHAQREAMKAKRNKPWNKLLRKLRREPEPETVQCATQ